MSYFSTTLFQEVGFQSSHENTRQSVECEDVLGFACSKSGLSGNLLQGAAIPLKGLVQVAFLPLCFVSYILSTLTPTGFPL